MANLEVRTKKRMEIYSLITSNSKKISSRIRKTYKIIVQFKMDQKVKLQLQTAKGSWCFQVVNRGTKRENGSFSFKVSIWLMVQNMLWWKNETGSKQAISWSLPKTQALIWVWDKKDIKAAKLDSKVLCDMWLHSLIFSLNGDSNYLLIHLIT